MVFQAMPLEGGSAGAAHAVLSSDHPYHGSVGLYGSFDPIAVFSDGSSLSQFRRWDGSGDYNNVANWLPAVDIGYADYPRLVSSYAGAYSPSAHPNGTPLFLLAGTQGGGLEVREWNGATFGPGTTISKQRRGRSGLSWSRTSGSTGAGSTPFTRRARLTACSCSTRPPRTASAGSRRRRYTAPVGLCICQVRAAMRGFDDIGVAVWEQGTGRRREDPRPGSRDAGAAPRCARAGPAGLAGARDAARGGELRRVEVLDPGQPVSAGSSSPSTPRRGCPGAPASRA